MEVLTRFVLDHKRLVLGLWLAVTVAAFAALQPANNALSQQFAVPGREGFETNKQLGEIYGVGGDISPLVPVVTPRKAPPSTRPASGTSSMRRSRRSRLPCRRRGLRRMPRRAIGRSSPRTAAPPSRWSTSRIGAEQSPARRRRGSHKAHLPASASVDRP